ncbi:MAG: hypothetical protein KKC75_06630 [Nanoarchaeota archaeon]|nr:hypothetical protein [Nanoarchaeota archaeon]MBU1005528.1 hypothetical protein [Nanoarchaeota archaeon]MBU1945867.1 hypothetical protein [Nanoarchaeota archaeon]
MWFFNKKKKEEHTAKRERIKNKYLRKLDNLDMHKKNAHKGLHSVIRNFFIEFFNIHYEFTYDELVKETKEKRIKKPVREKMYQLSKEIDNLKFGDSPASKEDLARLIGDCKNMIKAI